VRHRRFGYARSDLIYLAAVGCNIVIAIFTRCAAKAAQRSAELASQTAADAQKQSERMNETTLDATKANALATRIQYCGHPEAEAQAHGWNDDLRRDADQQEHLIFQLDDVLDKLGIGLGQPCSHSPHNSKIEDWKRRHAEALKRAGAA
jgi:hypothetical protein